MPDIYTLPLSKIIHELQLTEVYLPKSADDILIQSRDVVRPGIELSGYYQYFDPTRIAIFGRAEIAMLYSWKPEKRYISLESYFSQQPPAVIFAR
jgi:HPr kinase/phosphorylase